MTEPALLSAIRKLELYGNARNRDVDPVPRTVEITDDEAVALTRALGTALAILKADEENSNDG